MDSYFDVDGVTRGKTGSAGIGSILHNERVELLFMFSKYVGVKKT